ncbi:TerB family tellurite resistance protein [Streptomyces xiamenensis]
MPRVAGTGIRTAWRVIDDGDFFCPGCGGDRCYQRLAGRRRMTLLGVPLLRLGTAAPVVSCVSCAGHYPLTALDDPTTTGLSALLRNAYLVVALALLAPAGPVTRAAAVDSLREAGFPDIPADGLAGLPTETEVRDALEPLAPHLAAQGRESLLLHGARIALADGPYTDAERITLTLIGSSLRLAAADRERLLAAA